MPRDDACSRAPIKSCVLTSEGSIIEFCTLKSKPKAPVFGPFVTFVLEDPVGCCCCCCFEAIFWGDSLLEKNSPIPLVLFEQSSSKLVALNESTVIYIGIVDFSFVDEEIAFLISPAATLRRVYH